ncbi:hypothetical protein SRABI106_04838 [Rahnella aquatilis]|nr:hypothetical protein SRABI106_04838 [Rahnella aquatilis]
MHAAIHGQIQHRFNQRQFTLCRNNVDGIHCATGTALRNLCICRRRRDGNATNCDTLRLCWRGCITGGDRRTGQADTAANRRTQFTGGTETLFQYGLPAQFLPFVSKSLRDTVAEAATRHQ